MTDFFAPVDQQDENMKLVAEKFGDGENIDVKKLARSKIESDRHILTLEADLAALRNEVKTQLTAQELLTQLRQQQRQEVPSDQQPPVTPPAPQPMFDSEKAKTLFDELYEHKQLVNTKKQNQELVNKTLKDKFGNDAITVLNDKANELGVSLDYLARIAEDNPKIFFRTVGIDERPTPAGGVVAPRSSVQNTSPSNGTVRDNAYWARLKAADSKAYFSPQARKQRYDDALAGVYQP
jgi:hypothetical protein